MFDHGFCRADYISVLPVHLLTIESDVVEHFSGDGFHPGHSHILKAIDQMRMQADVIVIDNAHP